MAEQTPTGEEVMQALRGVTQSLLRISSELEALTRQAQALNTSMRGFLQLAERMEAEAKAGDR